MEESQNPTPQMRQVTGETVDMLALALALRRAAGENFEQAAVLAQNLADLMLRAVPAEKDEGDTGCQS